MKEATSEPNTKLAVIRGSLCAVAILTMSIYIVLCWRGFYAMNIDWYQLDTYIGVSKEELVLAYDQVMDYCMGYTDQFSAGIFPFSTEGEEHFGDVRAIFIIIGDWAKASTIIYTLLFFAQRQSIVRAYRYKDRSPEFWGVVGLIAVLIVVGGLASLNFTTAFTVFHMIFFPGKSNWLFDPTTDPVIYALPEAFFRNCAMVIGGLILVGCLVVLLVELVGFITKKVKSNG